MLAFVSFHLVTEKCVRLIKVVDVSLLDSACLRMNALVMHRA